MQSSTWRWLVLIVAMLAMVAVVGCASSDSDDSDGDTDTSDGDTVDGDEPDGDTVDGDQVDGDVVDGDKPEDGDADDDQIDVVIDGDDEVDGDQTDGEEAFNHANLAVLAGPFENGESVTTQCITCHAEAATDMLDSMHWNWEGESPFMVGHDGESHGKKDTINNFCIAVDSNEGRCTQCHAGYGWTDKTFDFNDKQKIDCLVCHDTSGQYKKEPSANGGGGQVKEGVDLVVVAKSVGEPSVANCGACHFTAGGGDNVKKGDMSTAFLDADEETDVHMGKGFTCQQCHTTINHQIAGASLHSTPVEGRVLCMDCHGDDKVGGPHENEQLNKHSENIACQTCHIPAFSRQLPTKTEWYWEEAGQESIACDAFEFGEGDDAINRPCFDKKKGEFVWSMNVKPTLAWFDMNYERMLLGDTFTSDKNGVVTLAKPTADITTKDAKLFPFKVMVGNQPADTDNNYLLPPHLYGSKGGDNAFWGKYD